MNEWQIDNAVASRRCHCRNENGSAILTQKKTSMADEKLSLRWNNHPSAFISALNKFLDDETMCDLTLSAGAQSLKVHSLVLCACSSYFEVIFFLPFFAEYFQ